MERARGTVQGRWVVIPLLVFIVVVVAYAAWVLFFKDGGPRRDSERYPAAFTRLKV